MNQLISLWANMIPGIADAGGNLHSLASIAIIAVIATLSYFLFKRFLLAMIHRLIESSDTLIDDVLLHRRVFQRIAHILPTLIVYQLIPPTLSEYPWVASAFTVLIQIYLVVLIALLVDSLIDSLLDIYRQFDSSKQVPVKSFAQAAKLVVYLIALIVIAAVVLGESPLTLFAGLGAMAAVLMFVFKDPILGFTAGLQLSYNKMVALGDWVDIPQHNASGDILEIGLTTVKVQNFDNTITTVPTQSLINESFTNWRGMLDSAGRRIKRAINIDVNSIQFCDEAALQRYSKVDFIKDTIVALRHEVDQHNQENVGDPDLMINGRRLTNVGTFRAYILAYLKNHPQINQELTLLVRQLEPTDSGLPIEIYAFSSEKEWAAYEMLQADIFDHLLAVAKEFDLRVFQKPTGLDLRQLRGSSQ